jgi:hypothetical protein
MNNAQSVLWGIMLAPVVALSNTSLSAPLPNAPRDLPVRYVDEDSVQSISSERRAKLVLSANAFASTITRGSRKDVSAVLARLYPDGIKAPFAYGLVYDVRGAYEAIGFRERLNRFG